VARIWTARGYPRRSSASTAVVTSPRQTAEAVTD
jgi:hypothetical protein